MAAATRAASSNPGIVAADFSNGCLHGFAPTNDAFYAAGFPTIAAIRPLMRLPWLGDLNHVVPGRAFSPICDEWCRKNRWWWRCYGRVANGVTVKAIEYCGFQFVMADVLATNGVVHVMTAYCSLFSAWRGRTVDNFC